MRVKPDVMAPAKAAMTGLAGTDPAAVRQRIELLEYLLESLVPVPGTRRRFGLDVILDVVPVGGSMVAALMGSYLAWEARNLGMPKSSFVRMAANIGIDAALGAIPWVGAIPDFFFKSNTRNLKLIKRHLDKHHPASSVIDA